MMGTDNESEKQKLVGDLDSPMRVRDLAEKHSYSEPQFARIARKSLGEPVLSVRRRLLLERAAYRLTRTKESVTEIAFEAGFESLEGFGRAFRAAFGLAPSQYRKLLPDEYRIDLSQRLHFAPVSRPQNQGETKMNVTELMTEHHCWEMLRFLDACDKLTASQLDQTLIGSEPEPWRECDATLRDMLGRAAAFAAPWMEAINGEKTDYNPSSLEEIRKAITINRDGFMRILKSVDKDQSYSLTFVDSLCDPPHVFSYNGVLAHALTNAAYRRFVIANTLRMLDVGIERVSDPIDYVHNAQKLS